jgi:hypothetical protein
VSKLKKPQEGSLVYFASIAFSKISDLSKSSLISDKLIGLNALIFVAIMSADISYWLLGNQAYNTLVLIVYLIVSAILALIISLVYTPVLDALSNFSQSKVDALRTGLAVLLISLPFSYIGLLYRIEIAINISILLVICNLVVVLAQCMNLSNIHATKDIEIPAGTTMDVLLGRGYKILAMLASIVTILTFILKYVLKVS